MRSLDGFGDNLIENVDYVVCKICGYYAQDLSKHLKVHEKITSAEYMKQFPDAKILCDVVFKERSDKIAGDKNPRISAWRQIVTLVNEKSVH